MIAAPKTPIRMRRIMVSARRTCQPVLRALASAATALGALGERNEIALESAAGDWVVLRRQQIANCCFTQYAVHSALHGTPKRADRTVGRMRTTRQDSGVSITEIVSVHATSEKG